MLELPHGYSIVPVGDEFDLYFHKHYVLRRSSEKECQMEAQDHNRRAQRERYWLTHQKASN